MNNTTSSSSTAQPAPESNLNADSPLDVAACSASSLFALDTFKAVGKLGFNLSICPQDDLTAVELARLLASCDFPIYSTVPAVLHRHLRSNMLPLSEEQSQQLSGQVQNVKNNHKSSLWKRLFH